MTEHEHGPHCASYLLQHLRLATGTWRRGEAERERWLREAMGAGIPDTDIAEAAGVSTQTIYQRRWRAKKQSAQGA